MRRQTKTAAALAAALVVIAAPLVAQAADPGQLYGRIRTVDNVVHEGFIRWAGNEAGLYDVLSLSKPIPERNRRDADRLGWKAQERENRIEIFGIGITLPGDRVSIGSSSQSGIRFGHISSLEVLGSSRLRVLLKSGEEVVFEGGGDVGSSANPILVEDRLGEEVKLNWRDIRAVDFMPAPARTSRWGERLYGTLRTRDGAEFTGYVAWDMDEIFTSDVLDGDEGDRDHEIPFGRIRALARESSSATRVTLFDGDVLVLRGSNDVNSSNRDIMIADPALGEIRVGWEAFDRLELQRPPAELDPSALDLGSRLRGTVQARGGESHTGWIRWDNDEEFGWEILDGRLADGVDLDVELGRIRSIERVSYDASRVTLRDGRTFRLDGSNDVDDGNRGLYVERTDGTLVLVPWDRFESVTFDG